MNTIKHIAILFFSCFFITYSFSQDPINRVLPADNYFYNPTINTSNTMSFPNGAATTASLQGMIDALSSSGGVLTINAGTYTLGQVNIKSNVHIRVHPDVVFKTTPSSALFRVGYVNTFANINNWSFQSTNGQKFTFDFSDMQPNDDIRAFQLGNTNNFRLADFIVLDNYTKFNAVSSGAVGNTSSSAPFTFASFGIIENLDIEKAHYGYGLIQCQVGQNILFRDLSGEGGVTLRLESGFEGLADRYLTEPNLIIDQVYGRNISCTDGAHAVMISPHTITQGIVDIRDITGISCEAAVSINFGFLSASKGQADMNGNAINGHSQGTFSEDSVIANVTATYGTNAQVRAARLRHVPCALRGYIDFNINLDDESYKSPTLAPIYYLALEDYVSFNNPAGRFQVVLDVNPAQFTGFSSEIRADGLITDGGDNDFEGCDIDSHNSIIWIKGEDKNTPNPLQTSTMATLGINDFNKNDISIYQDSNSKLLKVKSDFTAEIKIYNLLGQLVKNTYKIDDEVSIDISNLSSSIYIMNFHTEGKILSIKMILN